MEWSEVVTVVLTIAIPVMGWFVRRLESDIKKAENEAKEIEQNLKEQISDLKERLTNARTELISGIANAKKEISTDTGSLIHTLSSEVEKRRQADIDIYHDIDVERMRLDDSIKIESKERITDYKMLRELIAKCEVTIAKLER